ncbi:MAG TPA: DUF4350 domain-containing protein, partial [Acidimicrobiales bacterium]|nr:DUF4350 domain-containing protein [Acidimicrobiales bacterium]
MTLGLIIGVGVIFLVIVSYASPGSIEPLSPTSTAPSGTKAVVELLNRLGSPVSIINGGVPSGNGFALVLSDSSRWSPMGKLGGGARSRLAAWVRSGGHLVVADPLSALAKQDISTGNSANSAGAGSIVAGGCSASPAGSDRYMQSTYSALDKAPALEPTGGKSTYYLLRSPPSGFGCFGSGNEWFVVGHQEGRGSVIAIGTPRIFENENLGLG